ncbi:unnamed protein product [Cuscuta europaea]|uniref:Homeobox domain-containing protein n=1 Tax=Cuscuta europaea TaxID=41803 RepID=A0A9P1E4B5_CUSEU|nr:unnamed protein product [Cuscuta europaea]
MATYFSGLADQREDLPMPLLPNEKHNSYQPPGFPSNLVYLNHPSTIASYPELSSLSSYSTKPFDAQSVEQNLHYQGLSLSLAMQVPSSVQIPPYHDPYTNSGFSSLMATQIMNSDHGSQNDENKHVEYSFGSEGDNHERSMDFSQHINGIAGSVYNSKYLKATQELLDEVVNVHRDIRRPEKRNLNLFGQDEEADMKSSPSCFGAGMMSSEGHSSTNTSSGGELSAAERHDLDSKITKLFSLLDEVDKRYRQYHQQMQDVVSCFEMIAGLNSAKPYTSLALRTISCQFRCLRDAIKRQIQVAQKSLGEEQGGGGSQGERLHRLRYVDQKLRQQRSLQQFGGVMMRQPWRPQRGLPENAVSVLRAWLFEHFLHPYPKDSEKSMLARQTGLTRSQVANWFINARVRLWKPMIEDMYKEEFGDTEEGGSTASPKQISEKDKSLSEERDNTFAEQHTALSNQTGDEGITQPNSVSMFGGGTQVSLALGLKQNQNNLAKQLRGVSDKAASSTDIMGKAGDYYYMDQQERFVNSHLLPDFVL